MNCVSSAPTIARDYRKKAALRRPIVMVLPPRRLPRVKPSTAEVLIRELFKFSCASSQPNLATKIGVVTALPVKTIAVWRTPTPRQKT